MNFNLGFNESLYLVDEVFNKDMLRTKRIVNIDGFRDFMQYKSRTGNDFQSLKMWLVSGKIKDFIDTNTSEKSEDGTIRYNIIKEDIADESYEGIISKVLTISDNEDDVVKNIFDMKSILGKGFTIDKDMYSLTFDMEDDRFIIRGIGQKDMDIFSDISFTIIDKYKSVDNIEEICIYGVKLPFKDLIGKTFYFKYHDSLDKVQIEIL